MQVIKRELPEKDGLVEVFKGLSLGVEAAKVPKSRKNSIYVTLNSLKKKGYQFKTKSEGNNILVWRVK